MDDQSFLGMDATQATKEEHKKGFLSKLFGKKEKKQDGSVKVNIVSSESELQYDDWDKNDDKYELNEADIDNIRQALGLKTPPSKKSSVQKFEKKIESKKTSVTKPSKSVISKVFPKKSSKVSQKVEDLPAFNTTKSNSADSASASTIANITKIQKEWSEFSGKKLKTTAETKQVGALDRTKKSKIVKEFESTLKRESKKYDSKVKKEATTTISRFKKEIAELAKRDHHLRVREEKLIHRLRKLDEQEAELEEDISRLEAMKGEILYLEEDKKKISQELAEVNSKLEEVKSELALIKKELESTKAKIKKEHEDSSAKLKKMNKEYQDEEQKHKKELKELTDKISSAKVTLGDMQKKGTQILNQLKKKEDDLKKREQSIASKLDENKSILDKLEATTKDLRPSVVYREPPMEKSSSYSYKASSSSDPVIGLKDKLSDCKDLIDNGHLDDAKALYNEIREDFSKISGVSDAEKEKLKHDIREVYDEISLKIMNPPKRSSY